MVRLAKKPAILEQKKKLAQAFLISSGSNGWVKKCYSQHPEGYYWTAVWEKGDREVRIFVQMYARRRTTVDTIYVRWNDTDRALTTKEIRLLLKELS